MIIKLKRRNVISSVLFLMRNTSKETRWFHVKLHLRIRWGMFVEDWKGFL